MVDCYKCAFKHISVAKRVYYELRHGYHNDVVHIAWFVAEMACAADHLADKQPDMAEALRKDRLQVSEEMLITQGPPKHLPEFDGYLKEVYRLMLPPASLPS